MTINFFFIFYIAIILILVGYTSRLPGGFLCPLTKKYLKNLLFLFNKPSLIKTVMIKKEATNKPMISTVVIYKTHKK